MNTHNYLTRIKDTHWEDIQLYKTPQDYTEKYQLLFTNHNYFD